MTLKLSELVFMDVNQVENVDVVKFFTNIGGRLRAVEIDTEAEYILGYYAEVPSSEIINSCGEGIDRIGEIKDRFVDKRFGPCSYVELQARYSGERRPNPIKVRLNQLSQVARNLPGLEVVDIPGELDVAQATLLVCSCWCQPQVLRDKINLNR